MQDVEGAGSGGIVITIVIVRVMLIVILAVVFVVVIVPLNPNAKNIAKVCSQQFQALWPGPGKGLGC